MHQRAAPTRILSSSILVVMPDEYSLTRLYYLVLQMYSGKGNIVQIMEDRNLPLPDIMDDNHFPQHAIVEGWQPPWYDYWMEYMELGDLHSWLENRQRSGEVEDSRRHWNEIPANPPAGSNRPPARVILRHQASIPRPPGNWARIDDDNITGDGTLAGGDRNHLRYPDMALWQIFLDRECHFFFLFCWRLELTLDSECH
jgi:hypothetical protein